MNFRDAIDDWKKRIAVLGHNAAVELTAIHPPADPLEQAHAFYALLEIEYFEFRKNISNLLQDEQANEEANKNFSALLKDLQGNTRQILQDYLAKLRRNLTAAEIQLWHDAMEANGNLHEIGRIRQARGDKKKLRPQQIKRELEKIKRKDPTLYNLIEARKVERDAIKKAGRFPDFDRVKPKM